APVAARLRGIYLSKDHRLHLQRPATKAYICTAPSWLDLQRREAADDFHRLQADGDDALEKFQRIGRIANGFDGISVGVVDNIASLVGFRIIAVLQNSLSLHYPFKSRLTVDDVFVSLQRDILHSDIRI